MFVKEDKNRYGINLNQLEMKSRDPSDIGTHDLIEHIQKTWVAEIEQLRLGEELYEIHRSDKRCLEQDAFESYYPYLDSSQKKIIGRAMLAVFQEHNLDHEPFECSDTKTKQILKAFLQKAMIAVSKSRFQAIDCFKVLKVQSKCGKKWREKWRAHNK